MLARPSSRFAELKATNQLPSPTGVALALLRLGESQRCTAQGISRILQSDASLSGRLLKLANSAFAGRSRPATCVRDAVAHLGVRMARSVALSFSLVSQHGKGACQAFDYSEFWSHSLAMGIAAQAGACHIGKVAPHEAFTCGLLAQVGRLAFATVFADSYSHILTQVGKSDFSELRLMEREQFATDHSELAAAMLCDWGLPEACVQAVEIYEAPDERTIAPDDRAMCLVQLLGMASRVADVCIARHGDRSEIMPQLLAAGEVAGIDSNVLLELCDQVVASWHEWGSTLQVETRAVPAFAELAERAKSARPGVGNEQPDDGDDTKIALDDAPLNIVVVDDDPIGLRVVVKQLRTAGHMVHSARDGTEALRLVVEVNPQLVITDWQMPGMDGSALVKALRQTKMGRQMYILMVTGSEEDETQVEAFEAGADDYVVKPLRPRLLAARLRACARVLRLQAEVRRDKEELRRFMAELGVANRRLQRAAMSDSLTGLYNRRFALERLGQEWAGATRTGQPLTCMIIDIDHFKRVNDTYGHDAGDRVLQATAELLRNNMRPTDVVCRFGGEEFVVIGPRMDVDEALACAERLRACVAAQTVELATCHVSVTLSIGVANRSASMTQPDEVLKAADEAVYVAKASGRNQVRLAAGQGAKVFARVTAPLEQRG